MNDFKFRSVVYQEQLEGLAGAGLIGLSPSDMGGAQLFVPSLYKQGAIKNNMFSMFIDQNDVSKIQLGGYDLKKYACGDIHWYPITNPHFWEVGFNNVRIGDFHFQPVVSKVMADTGTSLNMIPDADFNRIYQAFFADKFNCRVLPNSLTGCDCTASQ